MPIKIEVQTNINDCELTIETCSQIIEMLQQSYKNIRKEMYNYFLGMKHLSKAMILVGVLFLMYVSTKEMLFVYLMPLAVLLTFIFSIVSAEYLTSQSKKQIQKQIKHFIEKKELLLKNKDMELK